MIRRRQTTAPEGYEVHKYRFLNNKRQEVTKNCTLKFIIKSPVAAEYYHHQMLYLNRMDEQGYNTVEEANKLPYDENTPQRFPFLK